MSILIKGVEMPETCYDCPLAAALFRPTHKSGRKPCEYACILTQCALTSTKRNRNCPLVELPPHGKLIDAFYVRNAIIQECIDKADDSHMYKRGMEDVYEVIRNAPTIVEAEENNDNNTHG